MAPVIFRPDANAAVGIPSPSSQLAWWGSPQAIWVTSTPRSSSRRLSSAMLATSTLQLHTPKDRRGNSRFGDVRKAAPGGPGADAGKAPGAGHEARSADAVRLNWERGVGSGSAIRAPAGAPGRFAPWPAPRFNPSWSEFSHEHVVAGGGVLS